MEGFHQEAIEEEDYLHTGGREFIAIKNKQGPGFFVWNEKVKYVVLSFI